MPDAKDNAKASGDVHPPEVEDRRGGSDAGRPEAEVSDNTPPDGSLATGVVRPGPLHDTPGGRPRHPGKTRNRSDPRSSGKITPY